MRAPNLSLLSFLCFLSLIGFIHCLGAQCRAKVMFIYRGYEGQTYLATNLVQVLENKNFDTRKVTAIYSYGFTQTANTPSVRTVVDAYLQNRDYNFMIISCDSIISYTAFSANKIADDVTESLLKIFETGYDKFHIIGFSLGGQIAGLIGRKVANNSGGKYRIPRITALDPGQLPPFLGSSLANLNENDANFVDVIHTETKYFGTDQAVGHVNFWINGGILQPNCKNKIELFTSICSHLMSPKYWAESVKSKRSDLFRSQKCGSYDEFIKNSCASTESTSMGLYADFNARGNFYLQANLQPNGLF